MLTSMEHGLGLEMEGPMSYIRNKQEALDALAETLALPDRRTQIIDVNVKIILCLHPEARTANALSSMPTPSISG